MVLYFDTDCDFDLSTEKVYCLKANGDFYSSNKIHTVCFERFINKKIIRDSTQIKIDFARKSDNNRIERIYITFLEHRTASLKVGKSMMKVDIYPDILRYNDGQGIRIYFPVSGDTLDQFLIGEYVHLNNCYYKLSHIPEDGSYILFEKHTNKMMDLYSTQVGFKAIPISGESLTGSELSLKDFKGKYLLIYFWNSTCEASTYTIEMSIKPFYEKYHNKNFEILGVAVDKIENIKQYLEENNTLWPQIITHGDNEICRRYHINHYPTVYLIDPDGVIIEKEIEKSILRIEQYGEVIRKHIGS